MADPMLDPYATLGIPQGASRDVAARAHRRLAKQFHPDVNRGPAAAERMGRINDAWRILSDPSRRASYDARRGTPSWPGPGHRTGSGAASSTGTSYGPRTRTAGWAAWPESRRPATPRSRGSARPVPVERSFGDRPVVFVTLWVFLALLFFVGTWLGSIAP